MKVIGIRPPGDSFSYALYNDLVSGLDTTAIYMWGGGMSLPNEKSRIERLYEMLAATTGTVFLCVRDHFTCGDYDFVREPRTGMSIELSTWAAANPDRSIVLFTALEELSRELGDVKNIKIVRLGGDITNHQTEYLTLDPVLDKDLSSDRTFISLNRNARFHRVAMVAMLCAMGLTDRGQVTFLDHKFFRGTDFLEHVNWLFMPWHDEVRQLYIDGFPVMHELYNVESDAYLSVYGSTRNDNVGNFNQGLRPLYTKSFVELVSETTVCEPAFLITEKTLNSIYGCNFPIMISGQGAVALLREMGMDVFDDVVDHSYDSITDPLIRMHQAVKLNAALLVNDEMAKDLWQKNKQRFINNVAFAKEQLYNFYINRAKEDFCQALDGINK